jgi:hypothetical protein
MPITPRQPDPVLPRPAEARLHLARSDAVAAR